MANTLTVSGTTTLNQLDQFLKTGADRDQKILARQTRDGETVLYAKTKATTILDKLLGRTERRQERAREAVQSVFDRFKDANPRTGDVSRKGVDTLFRDVVSKTLNDTTKDAGITAGELRGLISATRTIMRDIPVGTGAQPTRLPAGPTLQSVGLPATAISTAADYLAAAASANADAEPIANVFGDRIAKEFQSRHDGAACEAFGLSDGVRLKSELKRSIVDALEAMQPAPTVSGDMVNDFVELAFNRAASQMLDDGVVAGTSTMVNHVKLPNVTLGGQEYKPTAFLGAGGFADVYEYTSVDDPADLVALKLTRNNDAKAIGEAATELDVHRTAYGDGSPQVIGLEGKVRLPDGRLGIAVEIAPNGDTYKMSELVRGAIDASPTQGSGKISQAEADIVRLTMLRDMAFGLKHLHDTQGITHYDFKSPNCFVGADGTIKVADFGLSLETDETTGLDKGGKVDNALFKAPELARAEDVRTRLKDFAKETYEAELQRETARIELLLPDAKDPVPRILARSVLEPRRAEIDDGMHSDRKMLFFDRKVDIWGMGASALHMFTGSMPLEDLALPFSFEEVEALRGFGANRLAEPLSEPDSDGKPKDGAIALKTGDAEIDKLLTSMLRPDPRDRASAADLLGMPVLNGKGVGGPEAKALIVALKSGDAAAIDQARQALSAVT